MARFRPSQLLKRNLGRKKGAAPLTGARIVVGLGNPGPHYAYNRHNVGARATADLSKLLKLPLTTKTKNAILGQGETEVGPLVIAQPRTFMNESGLAVQSLLTQHKAKPQDLILIVDEMDIEVGRIRIRPGGGDGGQKGMRSIKQRIGSTDYPRIRIGVGRPYVAGEPSREPAAVSDHLLSDSPREEAQLLREAELRAAEAVVVILRDGVEAAMNQFNA
jgi:PTH1 family peptidyl-tRNA hydrolase